MITTTFGSGGTYATLNLALDAVLPAAFATWSQDYVFEQVGDYTETVNISTAWRLLLNGHSLTIRSAFPHLGNPNSGYKISMNGLSPVVLSGTDISFPTAAGDIYIEDLNIENAIDTGNTYAINLFIVAGTAAQRVQIKNTIVAHKSTWNYVHYSVANFGFPMKLLSSKIDSYTTGLTAALPAKGSSDECVLENTTFNKTCDLSKHAHIVRNCYAYGFEIYATGPFLSTGYNNASEGATPLNWGTGSSGNIGLIVPANEFKSTDLTSNDWLFLKNNYGDGGLLGKSGTTPGIVTTDISGYALPDANLKYPIGCHKSLLSEKKQPKSSIFISIGNSLYSVGRKAEFEDDLENLLLTNHEGNVNSDGSKKYMDILINS